MGVNLSPIPPNPLRVRQCGYCGSMNKANKPKCVNCGGPVDQYFVSPPPPRKQ